MESRARRASDTNKILTEKPLDRHTDPRRVLLKYVPPQFLQVHFQMQIPQMQIPRFFIKDS
jgi:hypothetical protein